MVGVHLSIASIEDMYIYGIVINRGRGIVWYFTQRN